MTDTQQFDGSVTELRRRYLAPGIEVRVTNLTDALGGYTTEVKSIDDRCIWIGMPLRRDGLLNLSIGELVSVRFDRDGDAAYLFDTVVAEITDSDTAPYGLAWPVSIDRRPHRCDVRLALVLDATYSHRDSSDRERVGKIVDLSASGLALITDEELNEPTHLVVRTTLPHPDRPVELEQPAEVRTKAMYGRTPAGSILWRYGLQLVDVDDELRDEILAAVVWTLTRNPAVL